MSTIASESDYVQFERLLRTASSGHEFGLFGDYLILKREGCGTMGLVYRAQRSKPAVSSVVLKVLKQSELQNDQARLRFARESSKVAAQFDDHIMPVLDIGEVENTPFFTMPFVPGATLEATISESMLPIYDVFRIGIEIAQGLSTAHDNLKIIHRDLKPSNIWISRPTGVTKLLDFGLALPLTKDDPRLTTRHGFVGTPLYCSPEQARFEREYDHRSDLFSLGTILYRLATGELPFTGDSVYTVLNEIIHKDPVAAARRNSRTPSSLSDIIAKLLSKTPERRFTSANEVVAALRAASPAANQSFGCPAPTGVVDDAMLLAARILATEPHRICVPFGQVVAATAKLIVSHQLRRHIDNMLFALHTLEEEILECQPFDQRDIKARAKAMVAKFPRSADRSQSAGVVDVELNTIDAAIGSFLHEVIGCCDGTGPLSTSSLGSLLKVISATRIDLKELGLSIERVCQRANAELQEICVAP